MLYELKPQIVETIPGKLEEGVLYVSLIYHTAIHKCACGCGNETVTPFSPLRPDLHWTFCMEGEFITLRPSIGNWNFPCRSHYYITRNKVEWL